MAIIRKWTGIVFTRAVRFSMRIGTWNVEYASPSRLPALREVLGAYHADIWVFTETHDDLSQASCPRFVHSKERPKNSDKVRPGSHWVSIWSAFPIIEQVFLEGADDERTVIAMLNLGARGKMLVYGTVLPWKGDRNFDWSEHHRVIAEQCKEWRALRQRFPDAALCVAGDYNTDMGTGSYYGTRRGISDLRAGLTDCELFCATSPERMPPGLLEYPPIDHIALPEAWREKTKVTAAWPGRKGVLSAHSGLIVSVDP